MPSDAARKVSVQRLTWSAASKRYK